MKLNGSCFCLVMIIFLFYSCINRDQEEGGAADTDEIYFDYKISGGEDKENMTVMLQFRNRSADGATLELESPSKVELDGEALVVDTTVYTGAYYEIQKPLASFTGNHTITFTDINNKRYTETFAFEPFTVESEIGESVARGELSFKLNGLKPTDVLQVILTDTAFTTNDITDIDTVQNGVLLINEDRLRGITSGPVSLQLIKEEALPVKSGTKAGGRILISYTVSRDFELKD